MKKLLSLILVLGMLLSLMVGCGTESGTADSAPDSQVQSQEAPNQEAAVEDDSSAQLPVLDVAGGVQNVALPLVEEETSVSFWLPYPFFVGDMVENLVEDVTVLRELQSRTGITLDVTAINGAAEEEQFNLMIAAQNYCDVITGMSRYGSGYDVAIEEEIIIDLYDLVKEYAPNYWYYVTQDINTLATLVTEEGNLPTIATLFKTSGSENQGYAVRYDWLEELGLDVPQTYEELEHYVSTANETYGAKGMILASDGLDELLAFGYDCGTEYLVVDGQVKSSLQQDSFRDYMEMVTRWYKEGIIYSDFYLYGSDDTLDQMFCSGQLAVDTGRCTSYEMFAGYTDVDYSASYGPMKPVRVNAGDEVHYSTTVDSLVKKEDTWSVTTACPEDKYEVVMSLVNYLFSEDGQLLFNWGVEGEAYNLNDAGEPEYTDMMINDPDTPYLFTAYLYASNTASEYAPSVMDVSKQYYSFDDTAWLAYEYYLSDGADCSYNYPAGAALNAEELTDAAAISSDLDTYVETQILSFITGQDELNDESWDQFQETLNNMGIDSLVSYYQAAYDRYEAKVAGLSID